MNNCPCCSTPMLRHIQHKKVYWFCPSCYQEMPNLTDLLLKNAALTDKIAAKKELAHA